MAQKANRRKMRLAIPAWEVGWADKRLGVKIGGLGTVIEELPAALVEAAAARGVDLEVEVLSPCFSHLRRGRRLRRAGLKVPACLDDHEFEFEVYQATAPDKQSRLIYFWDELQLHWTNAASIYPEDARLGLRLYASVSQAMAAYIGQGGFDTVHVHDYHVGLIPFYLDPELLQRLSLHFTVHNASYQGSCWVGAQGYETLRALGLSEDLFHRYFDHFGNINLMKAAVTRIHELGGRITTVSGDLRGNWGYARELRTSHAELVQEAQAQKAWAPVRGVFLANRGLDVFEKIPVAGITNGLGDKNRPDKHLDLSAISLRARQKKSERPFFRHPEVQSEMLRRNHRFDLKHLDVRRELKRLLHLEAFSCEPRWDPILFTAVGRLVEQKNLGLVAQVAERIFARDPGAKLIVLGSPGDATGWAVQRAFEALAQRHPKRLFFSSEFNQPLSRLILAGGDFCLIPSRFEPCGLVDYEASLMGNIVIAHRTGGLAKVAHCAYLYDWLDTGDPDGEAGAFFEKIHDAIYNYRLNREHHDYLLAQAMQLDASWSRAAAEYLDLYRYGFQMKRFFEERKKLIRRFSRSLKQERGPFEAFLEPAREPYGDPLTRQLYQELTSSPTPRPQRPRRRVSAARKEKTRA